MRAVVLVALAVVACRTEPTGTPSAPSPPAPPKPLVVVASASAARVAEVDAAPPSADAAAPHALASTGCSVDADCVLSAVSNDCCACDLDREHPVLKRALAQHGASCASADCKMPTGCPKVSRYDPAFERAECRGGRCVVVRWHSGG